MDKEDMEILFENELTLENWREYEEAVISANICEHIPQWEQEALVKRLLRAGLIKK